jgi:hypothetical protein
MKIIINNKEFDENFDNIFKEKTNYYKNIFIKKFNELEISTITCRFNFIEYIDINFLYNRFEINQNFTYITIGNNKIRGYKKIKKIKYEKDISIKNDKRKKNKGCSFSNQLIIGYKCSNKNHEHNNPISIKIFNNGLIQMTGCKSEMEIMNIYTSLYNNILSINNIFILNNNEYKYEFYKNIIEPKNIKIKYDMIISQIKFNFNLNQFYMHNFITNNKINIESIYYPEISTCYKIKLNELNNNDYLPTCSVFNNSINIISTSIENSINIYNYLKKFINDNFINIISYEY